MPHGDFSDIGGLFCFGAGLASIFSPEFLTKELGPLKGTFDGPLTNEHKVGIQMTGGLLMTLGAMFFSVRWNPVNGKLGGLMAIIAGVNTAGATFGTLDNSSFVPRTSYITSAVLVLTGLHLMFNPNPMKKDAKKE